MNAPLNLVQGTKEWMDFRAAHYGASEAASMLGLSKQLNRNDLLLFKKTGKSREYSDWVQKNILDYGHDVEAKAHLDGSDTRGVLSELLTRAGDRLRHLAQDVQTAGGCLLERNAHDLLCNTRDLDVHLQRGDTISVPATLKSMSPR